MTVLAPDKDIRVARWALNLHLAEGEVAALGGAGDLPASLAAATLAPALAALDPGGEAILVIDRLVLPALTLEPGQSNGETLARHLRLVRGMVEGATPAAAEPGLAARAGGVGRRRLLANRQEALALFALAASRQEPEALWLWRALGFLGSDEGCAAMPGRLARQLAGQGEAGTAVLWTLAGRDGLPRLLAQLSTPELVDLADALGSGLPAAAQGGAAGNGGRPQQPAGAPTERDIGAGLARRYLGAQAPALLDLPRSAGRARAMATARLALAMAGAAGLPEEIGARLGASAVALYAAAPERSGQDAPGARLSPGGTSGQGERQPGPTGQAEARVADGAGGPDGGAGRTARSGLQAPARGVGPGAEAEYLDTEAAGLLFLLPLLPEAGLFRTGAARLLARGGLALTLGCLAHHGLGLPLSEPALRAFLGLWPGRLPLAEDPGPDLPPGLRDRIAHPSQPLRREVARLLAGLDEALDRRPSTGLTLPQIIARPGRLRLAPAEMDLFLPMSGVDIGIRRAGLDASPGFLPWHGSVVRFHYDPS